MQSLWEIAESRLKSRYATRIPFRIDLSGDSCLLYWLCRKPIEFALTLLPTWPRERRFLFATCRRWSLLARRSFGVLTTSATSDRYPSRFFLGENVPEVVIGEFCHYSDIWKASVALQFKSMTRAMFKSFDYCQKIVVIIYLCRRHIQVAIRNASF